MSRARTHTQTCTRTPTHTHTHTLACAHTHLNARAEHLPHSIQIAPKNTARIHMCKCSKKNGTGICMCGFLPVQIASKNYHAYLMNEFSQKKLHTFVYVNGLLAEILRCICSFHTEVGSTYVYTYICVYI